MESRLVNVSTKSALPRTEAVGSHGSPVGIRRDTRGVEESAPAAAHMLRAFRPVLEREVFALGGTRGPVRQWPLDDFFEGLETADLKEIGTAASAN